MIKKIKLITEKKTSVESLKKGIQVTKKIVSATDNNNVPIKNIQINTKPINTPFDKALDFAYKEGLKDASIDDFLILNSSGEVYHNVISFSKPNNVIKVYKKFYQIIKLLENNNSIKQKKG